MAVLSAVSERKVDRGACLISGSVRKAERPQGLEPELPPTVLSELKLRSPNRNLRNGDYGQLELLQLFHGN